MENVVRKRMRSTKVCDFCKKRKVKCNRESPCSTCIQYNNRNCHYEEVITITIQNPEVGKENESQNIPATDHPIKAEIMLLKQKLRNLEKSVVPNEEAVSNDNSHFYGLEIGLPIPNFAKGRNLESLFGKNPYYSDSDEINFSEGYTPMYDNGSTGRKYYGPLSFYSLVKVDPALRNLHETLIRNKISISKIPQQNDNASEELFVSKLTDMQGDNLTSPYNVNMDNKNMLSHLKTNITEKQMNFITLGVSLFLGGMYQEFDLLKKIELVLPSKRVIWILFRRYFDIIYQHLPIFDEIVLQEQIEVLIGCESDKDEKIVDLKIKRNLDFLILGQLLVVLRFAYLTLFTNIVAVNVANSITDDPNPVAQEIKFLLNNPISIETINLAHECLNQFNLFGSINLSILQLAMAINYYHQYAPEDGFGVESGEAQASSSLLVGMAQSLGLHRDPDNFPEVCTDQRMNNLYRKLWYTLMIRDSESSLFCGLRMNIIYDEYDTKPPQFKPKSANIRNLKIEERVCTCYEGTEFIFGPLSQMFNMISKIRGTLKVSDVVKKLNEFELKFLATRYSEIWHHLDYKALTSEEIYFKIIKMKVYFKLNNYIMAICFHLFNYYESKKSPTHAFFYLKKVITLSAYELLPFYYQLLNQSDIILKGGTDLIITPGFVLAIHKSLVILSSLYIRVKSSLCLIEKNYEVNDFQAHEISISERFKKLLYFKELIKKIIDYFIKAISNLSHRYLYAWKVLKTQHMIIRITEDKKYFKTSYLLTDTNGFKFSNEMIDDLTGLLNESLQRVNYYSCKKDQDSNFSGSNSSYNVSNKGNSSDIEGDSIFDHQIDSFWFKVISMKNQDSSMSNNFDFLSNSFPESLGFSNYNSDNNWAESLSEKNGGINENFDFNEDQLNVDKITVEDLLRDFL